MGKGMWRTPEQIFRKLRQAEVLSGQGKTVFLIILKEHASFYEQWLKRGVLRKVGVLYVAEAATDEVHMYQQDK